MSEVPNFVMAPTVLTESGQESLLGDLLPDTCLLVFLDETGEESLSDPNYPLFGIGGCVVTVRQYLELVDLPWKYMKDQWFGGADKIFHATDYSGGKGTPEQYGALVHYFTRFPIGRIAAVMTKLAVRMIEAETYQLVAASLFERLRHVAKMFEFTEVAIIIESSSHYNEYANRYLLAGMEDLRVFVGSVEHTMPLKKFAIAKSSGESGLQIADAIINAAGGQARARWQGSIKPKNKDFQVVFGDSIDARWASYYEITGVRGV